MRLTKIMILVVWKLPVKRIKSISGIYDDINFEAPERVEGNEIFNLHHDIRGLKDFCFYLVQPRDENMCINDLSAERKGHFVPQWGCFVPFAKRFINLN